MRKILAEPGFEPGQLGEKHERYLCYYAAPNKLFSFLYFSISEDFNFRLSSVRPRPVKTCDTGISCPVEAEMSNLFDAEKRDRLSRTRMESEVVSLSTGLVH